MDRAEYTSPLWNLDSKGVWPRLPAAARGLVRRSRGGLAAEGVNLVLLSRGKEVLDKAAEELRKEYGVKVLAVVTDITSSESVKAAAAAAKSEFGTVHIVINNAGGPIRRMDRQITWADTEWLEDINLKTVGMLRVTQAFLPLMPKDGTGRIINNSGVAANLIWSPALTHGINNAGMNQATTYLALDLAGDQITVNAIVPGLVGTEAREDLGGECVEGYGGREQGGFSDGILQANGNFIGALGHDGRGGRYGYVSGIGPREIY